MSFIPPEPSPDKLAPLEYSGEQDGDPPPRFVRAILRLLIVLCIAEMAVNISWGLAENLASVNLTSGFYSIMGVGEQTLHICNQILGIIGAFLMLRNDKAGRRMVRFWAYAEFILQGIVGSLRIYELFSQPSAFLGQPVSGALYRFHFSHALLKPRNGADGFDQLRIQAGVLPGVACGVPQCVVILVASVRPMVAAQPVP